MELVKKAEEKDDMSLVMKANVIKRKSEEKSKNVLSLEEAIAIVSEKNRKLQNKICSPGNCCRHTANADVNAEANCYFTVLRRQNFAYAKYFFIIGKNLIAKIRSI